MNTQFFINVKFANQNKLFYVPIAGDKIKCKLFKQTILRQFGINLLNCSQEKYELIIEDQQSKKQFQDDEYIHAFLLIIIYKSIIHHQKVQNTNQSHTAIEQEQKETNIRRQSRFINFAKSITSDQVKFYMIVRKNIPNIKSNSNLTLTTLINDFSLQSKIYQDFSKNYNIVLFFRTFQNTDIYRVAYINIDRTDQRNIIFDKNSQKNLMISLYDQKKINGRQYEHHFNRATFNLMKVIRNGEEIDFYNGMNLIKLLLNSLETSNQTNLNVSGQQQYLATSMNSKNNNQIFDTYKILQLFDYQKKVKKNLKNQSRKIILSTDDEDRDNSRSRSRENVKSNSSWKN